MKKYQQLVLVIVIIFSVCVLLVYRNEYIKLRTTFEIINVFSEPIKPSDCLILNETVPDSYLYRDLFSDPSPHWISVGENYVYSAFWQSDGNKQYAKAIGVGRFDSNKNYQCGIWFDLQDSVYSIKGKFLHTSIISYSNASLAFYEFICEVEVRSQGVPYVFVFTQKKDLGTKKTLIPIFPTKRLKSGQHLNHTALCVRPDVMGRTKNEMIEFINFHQVLGLSDLIVYDIGIHYGIVSKLKRLEGLNSFLRSISILSWNFPYDDIYIWNKAIEVDCIYRSSGKVQAVTVISLNQYLIPRQDNNILSMLKGYYNQNKMLTLNVPIQLCCSDMKNEKHAEASWPLVLRKCHCIKLSEFNIIAINPTIREYNKSRQSLSLNNGYIHLFDICNAEQKSGANYDSTPLRYFPDLMSSKLLRIWKSGVLFTVP